jgi:hypothetical protein
MGRPIKKKFFGNLINPYQNHATGGKTGVGGEGVASVTVTNTGTTYSQGATISFVAPAITGGIRATGTPVFGFGPSGYGITSITVTNPGTGYLTGPAATATSATTVNVNATATNASYTLTNITSTAGIYVGMRADAPWGMQASNYVASVGTNSVTLVKTMNASSATVAVAFSDQGANFAGTGVLTSNRQDAITIISYLSTASQSRTNGDILKQESSRRYLVQNSDGKGICHLTTGTLTAGTMHIIGSDFGGATYWITKLTAHKATVFPRSNTSTAYLSAGRVAKWTLGSATGTGVNTIISLNHTV